ncbi:MAG: aminotransferase class V-fold PLP-dependent enzyme [Candidatus Thorarchaeota archaeon]
MALLDIKSDFKIFDDNPDLAYFDSASTTLVPTVTTNTIREFLDDTVASARRGAHKYTVRASASVEKVRGSLATFLNTDSNQISFQKSIPSTIGSFALGHDWKGHNKDRIVIAQSEEHSVMVALQRAAQILNLKIDVIPVNLDGILDLDSLADLMKGNTGLVAVGETTIGLGVRNPIEKISQIVHENEAILITDATRSIAFDTINPEKSGVDILVFSGNIGLMSAPGLTIQWIEKELGANHQPAILGSSSVTNVDLTTFDTALQPDKFESGILNIPSIVGLGTSLSYLNDLKSRDMSSHLQGLASHLLSQLNDIPSLICYGNPSETNTIFGFNLGNGDDISCHDVALFLDEADISVRSGLLCAHPLIKPISAEGFIQVSLHAYNTLHDVDRLIESLTLIAEQLI